MPASRAFPTSSGSLPLFSASSTASRYTFVFFCEATRSTFPYYASFRIRLLLCTRKTSPGKRNHFHLIYLLHLRLEFRAVSDFVLSCKLIHFKTPFFFMQFLFVRPRFCLRLPSDSASRRTPLSLANSSYCHACSGLSPPSYYACRAHKQ